MFGILAGFVGIISSVCAGIASSAGVIASGITAIATGIGKIIASPTFGGIINLISALASLFGSKPQQETPEEMGLMMEKGEKKNIKPDDFDSTGAYIQKLREDIHLEKGEINAIRSDPTKCNLYKTWGCSAYLKEVNESLKTDVPVDLLKVGAACKMTGEQIGNWVRTNSSRQLGASLEDQAKYLNGSAINSDAHAVSGSIVESLKSVYPELKDDELYAKVNQMMSDCAKAG